VREMTELQARYARLRQAVHDRWEPGARLTGLLREIKNQKELAKTVQLKRNFRVTGAAPQQEQGQSQHPQQLQAQSHSQRQHLQQLQAQSQGQLQHLQQLQAQNQQRHSQQQVVHQQNAPPHQPVVPQPQHQQLLVEAQAQHPQGNSSGICPMRKVRSSAAFRPSSFRVRCTSGSLSLHRGCSRQWLSSCRKVAPQQLVAGQMLTDCQQPHQAQQQQPQQPQLPQYQQPQYHQPPIMQVQQHQQQLQQQQQQQLQQQQQQQQQQSARERRRRAAKGIPLLLIRMAYPCRRSSTLPCPPSCSPPCPLTWHRTMSSTLTTSQGHTCTPKVSRLTSNKSDSSSSCSPCKGWALG